MAQLKDLIVNGVSRFIGKVYASEFIGKLTGNADTATKATGDSDGNKISDTYLKKSGGEMSGSLQWNTTSLPSSTDLQYIVGIDAFADGGTMKWAKAEEVEVGLATKANALSNTTAIGSATNPVYINASGTPVKTTYTLAKSVPSNAVFTDTVYTHPSHTAKSSGLYKVTVDSQGHVSAATAVTKSDITALGIPASDTNTHYASKNVVGSSTATSNTTTALTNGNVYLNSVENGAVTSTHKISGSGATTVTTDTNGNIVISSTDNNTVYTHPNSGATAGTYRSVTVNAQGHVTGGSNPTVTVAQGGTGATDAATARTNLGITPANIGAATTSHGTHVTFSTTAPKANGTAAVGTATTVSRSDHVHPAQTSVTGSSGSCTGNSATATALTTSAGSATNPVYFSGGKPVKTTYTLGKSVPANAVFTDTTYSEATDSTLGLIKVGYTESGKNYPVELNDDGQAFVNVPWTDNNTTYSVVSTTANGLCPKRSGTTTKFLRDDGTWAVPPDTNTTYTLSSFGITATAAEINKLDGLTATVTELNYVDGVTSNIQTQLNGKANSSHTHSYLPLSGGTCSGEIISTSQNAFRAISGDYGFFIRNDGNATYFMVTASGDPTGNWTTARPLTINNSTGVASINGNADTVDGYHASSFLLKAGGTMTGELKMSGASAYASSGISAGVSQIRNIAGGTASATTTNCPDGALYGKYS